MESSPEPDRIEITPSILNSLNSTRKWTMFLSVLGFIFLGLLIIFGLVTSTFLTAFKTREANLGFSESMFIVVFIIAAAIYFFPVFYLFRFSRNMRDAIQTHNQDKLDKAFRNLRIYFTYIGILLILVLSIYVIALIAAGASVSFLKGS
jgi:magnesium-transporting ATPase (P-type)